MAVLSCDAALSVRCPAARFARFPLVFGRAARPLFAMISQSLSSSLRHRMARLLLVLVACAAGLFATSLLAQETAASAPVAVEKTAPAAPGEHAVVESAHPGAHAVEAEHHEGLTTFAPPIFRGIGGDAATAKSVRSR